MKLASRFASPLALGALLLAGGCSLTSSQLQARLDYKYDGGCLTEERNDEGDELDVLIGFRSQAIADNIEINRYKQGVFEPAPTVQTLTVPGVPVAIEKCIELVDGLRPRLTKLIVANAAGEVYIIDVATGTAMLVGQANLLSVVGVEVVHRDQFGSDPRKDIVIYGLGGGPFSSAEVFVDQGDGTYQPGGFPGGLGQIPFIDAMDLDDDDDEDLIVGVDGSTNNVRVLESDGAGNFAAASVVALPGTVTGIVSDDFTSDGRTDPLVLTIDFALGDKAHLLRNNGDLTLTSIDVEDVPGGPILATTGDLNSDGFLDAAVYRGSVDEISILYGQAGGTFGSSTSHFSPDGLIAMGMRDFNADGSVDLGVLSRFEQVSVLYAGDGSDLISERITSEPSSIEFASFMLGNFDSSADGSLDAVVLSTPSSTGAQPYDLLMLPWDGANDAFGSATTTQPLPFFVSGRMASADLDGINGPDLVITSAANGAEVMLNDGAGAFTLQPKTIASGYSRMVELRTIDANATMDAVLLDNSGLSTWFGQGDGSFTAGPTMAVPGQLMAVGRDADQTLHACVAHPALSDYPIFKVMPDGSFSLTDTVSIAPLNGVTDIVAGDWDGDGSDEFLLVVADDPFADTHVILLENHGAGQFAPTTLFTGTRADGFGPLRATISDIDGDGLSDAILTNNGNDFLIDEFAFVLQQEERPVTEPIEIYLRGDPSGPVFVADLADDGRRWLVTGKAGNRGAISALEMSGAREPTCQPDLTGSIDPNDPGYGVPDGVLDANDFFFYLGLFGAGNLDADLTGSIDPNNPAYGVPDGVLDGNDFFFYLDLFAQGCP